MSGPSGSGLTQKGAGLVGIVQRARAAHDGNGSSTSIPDGVGPSKGLPATGLKRNTQEWREEHADEKQRPNGKGPSRQSSSSSIPSNATGSEADGDPDGQQQEGADGSGRGGHERTIKREGGEDGRITQNGDAEVESPMELADLGGELNGFPPNAVTKGKSGAKDQANGNGHTGENGVSGDEEEGEPDDESVERMNDRARADGGRKSIDEMGRWPDGLPGVKDEDLPGPRNEIVLDPRISHIHYHQQRKHTGKGLERGPILNITADGEAEHPPGETPRPSREHSRQQLFPRSSNDSGAWRSANDSGAARPRQHARFSSFRDSGMDSDRPASEVEEDSGDAERASAPSKGQDTPTTPRENAQRRWSHLRQRVLPARNQSSANGTAPSAGKVTALAPTAISSLPITTELLAGQLPVMILKTWLDRDDEGHRAVPVLLGNLRFRVGDSVGLRAGRETGKEMFKLECEYGDGAVKWVIYRELRDFLSLHAHYKADNFGTSVAGLRSNRRVQIPEFPRMSIPYLKKFGGRDAQGEKPVGKSEYAQRSRDALQQYLVELIRAVIFRPESNRLCKFFELSSLTLSLAPRGGFQGKAGFLKIPGSNASRRSNQPGLTPTSWVHAREPKWFIVRDSYFVATDGPEATEFYDVFLIDQDFAIERPKRYYRTGFSLISHKTKAKIQPSDFMSSAQDPNDSTVKSKLKSKMRGHDEAEEADIDTDNPLTREMIVSTGEGKGDKANNMQDEGESHASQHTFYIVNSQRRLKLVARNARHMHQFIVSMERIAAQCVWSGRNRFDSFAPLRVNVAAQWLVDGRDYFWNLSRAINMAKDRIYIHDWWISPQLYLRRPGDERYRLDNLLKRKAEEGVKIFIIIYNEVSDKTTPVDSIFTKKTLTNLHPTNIMVQRSPSHFQTGTFYWSHHEKLCAIDETIAFMGGLDLCFGRWDTSQHVLTDEDHNSPDGPDGPVWRGKDYSNERVMEYSQLDKPFDDMFDRTKVPRMPWHDVGLQIVGQPARDLCRHFVQRWNLLIRTKNHKRHMPFLLPAADFTDRELHELKLQGTCEVQICRSVGPWSMGTLTKIEHSIQNAYVKSIELSEHFVYIENQFFITSTVVDGVRVENGIGDALVDRIIRAHRENTPWRACIVIPLLPGYTYPIDSSEASSVRLILECQNRTISRGTNSIFSRLRKEGIEPDEYITFFSLRGWAKFKSGVLTSEQVYIHGKTMIVDDRLVLCGSANINERSQRGDRDSELLAVVRDTDMIDGTMAGKPFKVGRFAHTLRMRLMREHVGVDVDSIEEDQLMSREPVADADEIETWDPDHEQAEEGRGGVTTVKRRTARERMMETFRSGVSGVAKGVSENTQSNIAKAANTIVKPIKIVTGGQTIAHHGAGDDLGDASERRDFDNEGRESRGFASSMVPTLEEKTIFERRPSATHADGKPLFDLIDEGEAGPDQGGKDQPEEAQVPKDAKGKEVVDENQGGKHSHTSGGIPRIHTDPSKPEMFGTPANTKEHGDSVPSHDTDRAVDEPRADDALAARQTLRKHLHAKVGMNPWTMPTPTPKINPNRFHDPLDERFWKDMWVSTAVHNMEIFRKVFRCVPDDLVTSWSQYKAFANHAEKFNKTPENVAQDSMDEPVKVVHDGPGTHGAGGGGSGGGAIGQGHHREASSGGSPSAAGLSKTRSNDIVNGRPQSPVLGGDAGKEGHSGGPGQVKTPGMASLSSFKSNEGTGSGGGGDGGGERKPSGPEEAWRDWEREEMETLLNEVRGHLVLYPTRFLEGEDLAGNFLFNSDKILPLPIYD